MKIWRAYCPDLAGPGEVALLGEEESHHLIRVLRIGTGAQVRLFDGRGAEREGRVEAADRTGVRVRIGAAVTGAVDPSTRLTLMQALCRPDRMEFVLQKGTELGVSRFVPVRTGSADEVRWTAAREQRWNRIILEACKQSGRRVLPGLDGPVTLEETAGEGPGVFLHPGGPGSVAAVRGEAIRLLVGPESGLTGAEAALLEENGWIPASLGPRILRTETAGLVGAALILAANGELGPAG